MRACVKVYIDAVDVDVINFLRAFYGPEQRLAIRPTGPGCIGLIAWDISRVERGFGKSWADARPPLPSHPPKQVRS